MGKDIIGISVSDEETLSSIRSVFEQFGYIIDPHTAVAFRALERYRNSGKHAVTLGIVLSTAHPAKFFEAICNILDKEIEIPSRLKEVLNKKKMSVTISADYREFASYLKALDR